jgi:hypothetical protein
LDEDDFAYTIASIVTHGYRIPIRNVSQAKTIKNVNVQLTNIQPRPPEYTWGSAMPLHWNHDNKPNAALAVSKFSRTRDLQAGTPEQIDLVYASTYAEKIFIFHIAENIDQQILRPADKYRITIEAKGDDVPAATAMFDVCIDKDGLLQCVAVKPK